VVAAGIVGLSIAAPNMPQVLHKLGLMQRFYDRGNMVRARKALVRDGLLVYEGNLLRLTEKGRRVLDRKRLQYETTAHRKWDGRWRVLIFDIPEKRKRIRDRVRHELVSVGFKLLQRSVWVYPYDCEDLIILLKTELKIGKDMLYMIVDELEYDTHLRTHFKLPVRK
jgi:CRISPR-associated endonuclease Cas2